MLALMSAGDYGNLRAFAVKSIVKPRAMAGLALGAVLTACPGQTLKTGQTLCYSDSGIVIACPGTGQDGELQKGLAQRYRHNGDGTVSDRQTGLMWASKSDDESLHDKDRKFPWTEAVTVFIASLNSDGGFAGHTDWRLPNINELRSIITSGKHAPAMNSAFIIECVPGCRVEICNCATSGVYTWSSTTYEDDHAWAWVVVFDDGTVEMAYKPTGFPVRAVRSDS